MDVLKDHTIRHSHIGTHHGSFYLHHRPVGLSEWRHHITQRSSPVAGNRTRTYFGFIYNTQDILFTGLLAKRPGSRTAAQRTPRIDPLAWTYFFLSIYFEKLYFFLHFLVWGQMVFLLRLLQRGVWGKIPANPLPRGAAKRGEEEVFSSQLFHHYYFTWAGRASLSGAKGIHRPGVLQNHTRLGSQHAAKDRFFLQRINKPPIVQFRSHTTFLISSRSSDLSRLSGRPKG